MECDIWIGWSDTIKVLYKVSRHEIMNQPVHGKFGSAKYLQNIVPCMRFT